MNVNIDVITDIVLQELRRREPYRSGNMAYNATKKQKFSSTAAEIYIDEKIAPYSVYTVIPWSETSPVIVNAKNRAWIGRSSFLWERGNMPDGYPKANPNLDWLGKAVGEIAEALAVRIGGKLLL